VPERIKPVICNFWHQGTPALSVRVPGCQKLQVAGLNQSGTNNTEGHSKVIGSEAIQWAATSW